MLEEIGMEYEVHSVNIGKGEQKEPEFLKIGPNNKIPVIVDQDNGLSLMESGAILQYLGKKSGQLMPGTDTDYWKMQEWLMFQMGGIGPIFGQVHHFKRAAKEQVPYAINRYYTECRRLYGVLDGRLEGREYLAGDISIADFATLPWVFRFDWQEVDLNDFPNVMRWYDKLMARPALARGMDVPS